jgi:hypothetical protein
MRSTQRDQTGYVVFAGFVGGGPSGSGIAENVPFTFTRTGTGDYTLNFDAALAPVVSLATSSGGQAAIISASAGALRVQTFNTTGVITSSSFWFSVTARKL